MDSPVDLGGYSPLKTAKIKPKLSGATKAVPTKMLINRSRDKWQQRLTLTLTRTFQTSHTLNDRPSTKLQDETEDEDSAPKISKLLIHLN